MGALWSKTTTAAPTTLAPALSEQAAQKTPLFAEVKRLAVGPVAASIGTVAGGPVLYVGPSFAAVLGDANGNVVSSVTGPVQKQLNLTNPAVYTFVVPVAAVTQVATPSTGHAP